MKRLSILSAVALLPVSLALLAGCNAPQPSHPIPVPQGQTRTATAMEPKPAPTPAVHPAQAAAAATVKGDLAGAAAANAAHDESLTRERIDQAGRDLDVVLVLAADHDRTLIEERARLYGIIDREAATIVELVAWGNDGWNRLYDLSAQLASSYGNDGPPKAKSKGEKVGDWLLRICIGLAVVAVVAGLVFCWKLHFLNGAISFGAAGALVVAGLALQLVATHWVWFFVVSLALGAALAYYRWHDLINVKVEKWLNRGTLEKDLASLKSFAGSAALKAAKRLKGLDAKVAPSPSPPQLGGHST